MLLKLALRRAAKLGLAFTAITALLLAGCGGGGSSTPTPTASTLGGVAAVGYPIIGATVQVQCAAGSALSTTTSNTGTWQVTFSGQTAPCAVQVSGGTINGGSNTTNYHSITTTTSTNTANVSPLTDMVVANLVGTSTPDTWFAGLTSNPAPLSAITLANINASVANLAAALPQLPLGANNPLTMTFSATPGTVGDDMLAALQTAMTNSATTYATLLADASTPGFTAPAASFDTALTAAYAGTASGGSISIPAVPSGVTATAISTSQIDIVWTNVSGATSYNVYRSTSTGVQIIPGNKITSGATTSSPYADSIGLSASTLYYYKVTAVNAAGESGGSTEVSATTQAPATPAPTITSFTPGSGAVGTTVTITGTNLTAVTEVLFTGPSPSTAFASATIATHTATSISATVPASLAAGDYTISVIHPGGELAAAGTFTVTSSGGGGTGSLMGGAIQGVALNLSKTVTTLAGSGATGSADNTGIAATFYYPCCIATDGTNLYMTDTYNNKIRQIVIATGVVTTLAGSGIAGAVDGTGTAASFNHSLGITTDGTNVYVSDNYKIRKIVISTGVVSTLAGSGAYGSADGASTAASFSTPYGITTDGTNVYAADTLNHKIRQIVIATGVVTTLAGSGVAGAVDASGTAASFNLPAGITTDGTNLYVTEKGNYKVRKIVISTGAVTTLAGSGVLGAADGTGTAASFSYPMGISSDGTNLYISDLNNHNVRKIVIATGIVTTVAGSGSAGAVDATGTAASFYFPSGITNDGSSLYVADTGNNKIRKIQ
jgi:hypothetical protein